MIDIEQIEAWRSKFIALNKTKRDTSFHDGYFLDHDTHYIWIGYQQAMRSQPVIELPKLDCHCFDDDTKKDVWSYMPDTVFNAITAAGYKYKVNE